MSRYKKIEYSSSADISGISTVSSNHSTAEENEILENIPVAKDALTVLANQWNEMQNILTKNYLQELSSCKIIPYEEEYSKDKLRGLRWYRIDRIIYEKGVFFVDKFSMIISALHSVARELVLLLHKENGSRLQLYIGASDIDDDNRYYAGETLYASLKGVFPGIQIEQNRPDELLDIKNKAVSSISAIGSLKDKDKEHFAQGLERLINATMDIPNFTAIMIAERVSEKERLSMINGYTQMYSTLSPLVSIQHSKNREISTNLTIGESEALSTTLTQGINRTIAHGSNSSQTQTQTTGTTTTVGTTKTKTTNSAPVATVAGGIVGAAIGSIIPVAGTAIGAAIGSTVGSTVGTVVGSMLGSSSKGTSESYGKSNSISEGVTIGTNHTESDGTSESTSKGTTISTNSSKSQTQGEGQTITITQQNKMVEHLLSQIDKQLERLDNYGALGMWNSATYIIAHTTTTAKQLANIYKGCVIGEESNFEVTAVNTWNKERHNEIAALTPYLKHYVHPRFSVGEGYNISAGSLVNSKDLAIHMALPQSSVPGVLVQERATFGREVFAPAPQKPFRLGSTFHLGSIESTPILLDASSFSKHVFVTGSTGSGKSNTVYHLLDHLIHPKENTEGIKVLVVEPAKGEYKHILKDAKVYGTNPNLSTLLRLNPFIFPEGIRIDEHVDRLVEIFNVCWPMYAAMPAVLKDAVLRAYKSCGWSLESSLPKYKGLYPTFSDVLKEVRVVIRSSEYSADTQGDYIGALETRLRSLTNGINAHIFSNSHCIADSDLFDCNVIVDLSRIGSSETRSLIMGMLVLKLSEYRMDQANGKMNQPLRHITVLEEAHNLLKRTSKEQSQESSNLQGKSVEMIANAIAEMRTYGEGFIIVDQSPTALDEAAIKNTNTKIIMSLPDSNDREIAGKSVGLTNEQIDEISRMPVGVGIVFQNNWSEAVMCQIDEYKNDNEDMRSNEPDSLIDQYDLDVDIISLLLLPINRFPNIENLEARIMKSSLSSRYKHSLLDMLVDYKKETNQNFRKIWLPKERAEILSKYLNCDKDVAKLCKEFTTNQLETLTLKISQLMPREMKDHNINPSHFVDYLLLAESANSKEGQKLYQYWAKTL
ncbi:helicase HerA domain-containing protein [Porphyromonas cangingivalis]|uniref:helicase HerA domain-containing protein n=1 Tax=Porphyromonas cangingivalis TaxID=36874 RepID=UPI00068AC0B7|nr:DUF87 domain-containing protein [Porphyromonas cangingivalis]